MSVDVSMLFVFTKESMLCVQDHKCVSEHVGVRVRGLVVNVSAQVCPRV